MEFLKLTTEHLKEVYDIRFSVTENLVHAHQIQYLQRQQALEDIAQGGGWICRVGEEYAGYGLGIYIPSDDQVNYITHALIGGLFVRPEYQGRHIGTELIQRITRWFFDKGTEQIELTTDRDSRAVEFYKNNGWQPAGLDEFGQLAMKRYRRDDE